MLARSHQVFPTHWPVNKFWVMPDFIKSRVLYLDRKHMQFDMNKIVL